MRSTRWWESLSVQDRRWLKRRLRYRDEVVVARFDDAEGDDQPIPSDLYEYLVAHELYSEDGRTFHICSAHAQARAVVRAGTIPRHFPCPRADSACPLRQLLAVRPGQDCRLRLGARPEGASR